MAFTRHPFRAITLFRALAAGCAVTAITIAGAFFAWFRTFVPGDWLARVRVIDADGRLGSWQLGVIDRGGGHVNRGARAAPAGLLGSDAFVGATDAIGPALIASVGAGLTAFSRVALLGSVGSAAFTAFTAVVALAPRAALCIARCALGVRVDSCCILLRSVGQCRRERFAFGIETLTLLTLGRALAAATAATAAASALTAAFAARTPTFVATRIAARALTARLAPTRTIAPTAALALVVLAGLFQRLDLGHGCWLGRRCKQILDPAKKPGFGRCAHRRSRHRPRCGTRCAHRGLHRFGPGDGRGRGRIGQHALDDRGLLVGGLLRATRHRNGIFLFFSHLVAGFDVVQAWIVVFETLELVIRGFERLVGHHQHIDALLEFDLGDLGALLIEQERGDLDRNLAQHRRGVVLEGLLLDDAQNLQRARFSVPNVARAAATRAGNRRTFAQSRAQPLPAHFHEAEFADGAELHAGTVLTKGVAQPVLDIAAVAAFFHVDKVDHDQAAEVAQAHLARHFVGGFQIGAGRGFFDVAALDGARRVHVDADQRFSVVDHDGAATGQLHRAGIGRFDLVFDLKAAEQWRIVAVALDARRVFGHHVRHELLGLLVYVVGVDQDVADVVVEVVADGANHERGFLVNQVSTLAAFGCAINRAPQFEQVVQVPLQLWRAAANAGGARDDAHAVGVFELVERFLEIGAVLAFDAA